MHSVLFFTIEQVFKPVLVGLSTNNPPRFMRANGLFGDGLTANFTLSSNSALRNAFFVSPENLSVVEAYDSFLHQTIIKHEWLIRCSDGDLCCVGDILGQLPSTWHGLKRVAIRISYST